MESLLLRKVSRRNPFRAESIPLVTRIYKYPFERWSSPGKQALFGVANIGLFYAYQRFVPITARGSFRFNDQGTERRVSYDGRNTQFGSIYFSLYDHGYEPEVTALLDVIVGDKAVFYDIGSNWGYLSLFVASRPGFKGEVHAFEPFPSTFRDLKNTVEQAQVADRVKLHNEAVSDQVGQTTMRIPDLLHSGWATMEDVQATATSGAKSTAVTTLDNMQYPAPDVLKVDAERSEAKIFRGGKKVLETRRPMIVFESLKTLKEPETTMEPFWILRDAGYEFFRPCWLRGDGERRYFLGGDSHAAPTGNDILALAPLKPEERFLSYEQLNVFACHRAELDKLRNLFSQP